MLLDSELVVGHTRFWDHSKRSLTRVLFPY